jgi:very-short-patch-repair endonuclease
MPRRLPAIREDLVELQRGIVTRQQALASGIDSDTIVRLVRSGNWQSLQRGVYSIFTGDPAREAVLWAALRRAGPEAALSHQTAAELHGLTDLPSSLVHVTIPVNRRISRLPGIVIHRSTRIRETTHPSLLPPRTRIEETVLDLVQQATRFDAAFGVACAACQRRLTTADLLLASMTMRKKMRWRTDLTTALADIREGVHSLLEHRYVHRVERPHRLPKAVRQTKIVRGVKSSYLDNLYAEQAVCVELDGRAAHPDDRRWQDIRRDNAAAAEGITTLRYTWADVTLRPCQTAAQVAAVLRTSGWTGAVRPCGPHCPIRAHTSP